MGKPLELPALALVKDDELDAAALLAFENDRLARAYAARATLGARRRRSRSPSATGGCTSLLPPASSSNC
jgi:hypothetical protein